MGILLVSVISYNGIQGYRANRIIQRMIRKNDLCRKNARGKSVEKHHRWQDQPKSEKWYFSIYSFDRKQLFDIILCYWFRFSFLLVRCYVVDNSIVCKRYMAVPSLFWYHYLYPLSYHCFAKYLFMIFLSMLFIFYRFEAEHVKCVQSWE